MYVNSDEEDLRKCCRSGSDRLRLRPPLGPTAAIPSLVGRTGTFCASSQLRRCIKCNVIRQVSQRSHSPPQGSSRCEGAALPDTEPSTTHHTTPHSPPPKHPNPPTPRRLHKADHPASSTLPVPNSLASAPQAVEVAREDDPSRLCNPIHQTPAQVSGCPC